MKMWGISFMGAWLFSYDGKRDVVWTNDINDALKFRTDIAAENFIGMIGLREGIQFVQIPVNKSDK